MALEYMIDSVTHSKLDESSQGLYKKTDDGYQLDVKGAVSKAKVDEFRTNNIDLQAQLDASTKKYKDVDLDRWAEMQKTEQAIKDKKLVDSGDIESLVASRVSVVESDLTAKNTTANERGDSYKAKWENEVRENKINGATAKAFADYKIRPDFHEPLTAQINNKFSVKDGQVVAMDGDKILSGKDGNLSIGEFVSNLNDNFKIPSSGGSGNGGGGGGGNAPRSSLDKITAGLAKEST